MSRYAQIRDGVVAEIITLPTTITVMVTPAVPAGVDEQGEAVPEQPATYGERATTLADFYHPDVAVGMKPCGPAVEPGWTWNGTRFSAPVVAPVDLQAVKSSLKAQIDAQAEVQRLRYITPGSGQAMTYARKVEQAKAAQADADPQPGDFPLLAASLGIDGGDVEAVAATVLAMDAAWAQIGAAIEAVRLNAKRAIDEAETAEAAQEVEPAWPDPA
ncbi:hypothetical protein AB6806_27605 [Bosea sp. RCC_152_1]|uniref:hypothetical protein n=1 Tax=Bosea sp. RCC_152_1 TaxID=3239228 RepID=UPI0035266DEB